MDIIKLVDQMSHDLYLRLKHAAETGKWPEGVVVDNAQREHALQLSMAFQARHLNSDQMLSIGADGEIVTQTKRELRSQFKSAQKTEQNSTEAQSPNNIARFTNL